MSATPSSRSGKLPARVSVGHEDGAKTLSLATHDLAKSHRGDYFLKRSLIRNILRPVSGEFRMVRNDKPKSLFIINLLRLVLPDDLGDGYEVFHGLWLTNNKGFIQTLLTKNLRKMIGEIEYLALADSKAVLYSIRDIERSNITHEKQASLLNAYLKICSSLTHSIWFIKDNSITSELGFIEAPHLGVESLVTSNFLSDVPTDSGGRFRETSLSIKELEKLKEIYQKYFIKGFFGGSKPFNLDNIGRLQRVFYFLQAARGTLNLPVKIAFYCTCYEAIFSTSSAELTHKLSERVALFLGKTFDERKNIFSDVKNAYGIRSTVVHGDSISSKTINRAKELAPRCDLYLRAIMNKILQEPELQSIFESSNNPVDDYFTGLLFNKDTNDKP